MPVQIDPDALRREIARRCLTGAEFAKLSGVSAATLSHALTRGRVGDPTLRKFARFLTVTPPIPGADALIKSSPYAQLPREDHVEGDREGTTRVDETPVVRGSQQARHGRRSRV